MRHRFWTFLTVILSSLIFVQRTEAAGNRPDITFTSITANDGLSQNTVLSIGQDKLGNLWFTTFDGLNRYDGYDFSIFRHDDNDTTSIGSNTVRTLFFGSDGRIWTGTASGLSAYDPKAEKFRNYPLPEGTVTSITEISPTRLLVGTEAHLRIFDTASDGFVEDGVPEYMATMEIRTLSKDGDNIYIGTKENGLFLYSISKDEYRRISAFRNDCQINVILPQESLLWVGTEGKGFSPSTSTPWRSATGSISARPLAMTGSAPTLSGPWPSTRTAGCGSAHSTDSVSMKTAGSAHSQATRSFREACPTAR